MSVHIHVEILLVMLNKKSSDGAQRLKTAFYALSFRHSLVRALKLNAASQDEDEIKNHLDSHWVLLNHYCKDRVKLEDGMAF
jgi:hypothetical protein